MLTLAQQRRRHLDGFFIRKGLDGPSGGHVAEKRHLARGRPLGRGGDPPTAVTLAGEGPLFLEPLQVFLDRPKRGEPEILPDLSLRRRNAALRSVASDEVQDFLLALGEIHVCPYLLRSRDDMFELNQAEGPPRPLPGPGSRPIGPGAV